MTTHMSIAEFQATKAKSSKYGNQKTMYKGEMYDSKKEADFARQLDLLRNATDAGVCVKGYTRQARYRLEVNGVLICEYVADFVVTHGDGRVEVVDVKGVRTDVYKLKKKLMKSIHGIDILEV